MWWPPQIMQLAEMLCFVVFAIKHVYFGLPASAIESLTKSAIETQTDKPRAWLVNDNSISQCPQKRILYSKK